MQPQVVRVLAHLPRAIRVTMARTIEQRAASRAKRKNNDVEDAMPLLTQAGVADQFMTTPETEKEWLYRKETNNFWWFERLKRLTKVFAAWAAHYRHIVAQTVSPDELAALDRTRSWMPRDASYGCDFWHCQVRDRGLDPNDGGGVEGTTPPL